MRTIQLTREPLVLARISRRFCVIYSLYGFATLVDIGLTRNRCGLRPAGDSSTWLVGPSSSSDKLLHTFHVASALKPAKATTENLGFRDCPRHNHGRIGVAYVSCRT